MQWTVTPTVNGKRPRQDVVAIVKQLAKNVQSANASRPPLANAKLVNGILEAIATGTALPSRAKHLRGCSEFESVGEFRSESAANVILDKQYNYEKLRRSGTDGARAHKALQACAPTEEDLLHFDGHDGEILRALVDGTCPPRIQAMRAVNPFNPVALLTPPSEDALCAVAAETIYPGEPIAIYTGDVVLEDDPDTHLSNTYMYEVDMDELKERGYNCDVALRIDGSTRGSEARYINDKWGAGLPERLVNCFSQLVFDGKSSEFLLVFFASRRIPTGREVIADYGPDYWDAASEVLLGGHT